MRKSRKMEAGKAPKLLYESLSFEESNYRYNKKNWMATTLLKAVHDQELEPFEYPLAAYDMTTLRFDLSNMDMFIYQMKRVLEADYENNPIILDSLGQVADGNHRICHAILDGKRSILAYRLLNMPEPDFVETDNG